MYVGLLGDVHHLVHADLPAVVPVLDVLPDAPVEEDRLLRDEAQVGPQPGEVQRLDVGLVNVDTARVDIVETLNKLK